MSLHKYVLEDIFGHFGRLRDPEYEKVKLVPPKVEKFSKLIRNAFISVSKY